MVKETRVSLDPCDIDAIIVVCRRCKGEMRLRQQTIHIGDKTVDDTMQDKCPHCCHPWKGPTEMSAAASLRSALRKFQGSHQPPGYTVRIETTGQFQAGDLTT